MMINDKFSEACRRNDVNRAKALMVGHLKIDVNKANCLDKTPIFQSIEARSLQAVAYLISIGTDLHKTSTVSIKRPSCSREDFVKYHEPPLVTAARAGDIQSLELLLANGCHGNEFATLVKDVHTPREKDEGNERSEKYFTDRCYAVHYVVVRNNPRMLEALLVQGGQAEVRDHEDRTPLHYACACKRSQKNYCWDQVEIMRLLLLHGGNPHVNDRLSVTPLALAINYDCLPAVEIILSAGPSPPYQVSIIGLATLKKRHDIVIRLVRGGFKLNILNSRFQTPIQTEIFHQPVGSIAGTLIFHGCDINCFHRTAQVPSLLYQTMKGCRIDCESIAFLLLEAGYDINQDTWLLESTVIEKYNNQQTINNPQKNYSDVILSTNFFSQDTLIRFGTFKHFPVASGRMTVLKNHLIRNLRTPRRLTTMCRATVRSCVSACNRGVSVVGALKSLPLPTPLISFLLLGDVAMEMEDGAIQVNYPF